MIRQAPKHSLFLVVLTALALGMSPGRAVAQRAGPLPCRQDVKEFCANHEPGHGAVPRCLQEHAGAVSSTCRAFLQERRERGAGSGDKARQICRARSGSVDCVEKRRARE